MEKYKNKKQYRYKGYDYSQNGFYFITICTKNREMFFGDIQNEKIKLSDIGLIANKFWLEIPNHFPFVRLDEYVIMPDHIHGIIKINNNSVNVGTGHCPVLFKKTGKLFSGTGSGTGQCPVPTGGKFGSVKPGSLSTIIGSYKSVVTKNVNKKIPNCNFIWQSRFHDRIIRNDNELNKIRQYIIDNPLKWELDGNNQEN